MTQPVYPQYTFVVSGTGDKDMVTFHLNVWEKMEGDTFESRVQYDNRVQMDGDGYGPAEWIREALLGIIEGL